MSQKTQMLHLIWIASEIELDPAKTFKRLQPSTDDFKLLSFGWHINVVSQDKPPAKKSGGLGKKQNKYYKKIRLKTYLCPPDVFF